MKGWFQARQYREQVLVAVFVLLGAGIWLSSANGRLGRRLGEWRSSREDLAAQQLWLDRAEAIRKQSADAVRNLDPARTYDATRLATTVSALAGHAGLVASIDPPVTQQAGQFAYHQVRVTFSKAVLPALLKFSDELARQAPYLNLEEIVLQSGQATGDTLNATLQISATQIAPGQP